MLFDVILADPCWPYRNVRTGGSHKSGSAQIYPTMALDQIAAMPVSRLAAKDSVCFLWATTPMGADPYTVLEQWGYAFKTEWYWHKTGRKGLGYWTRGCVEKLLIGVRGSVKAWRSSLDNWVEDFEDISGVFESKPEGHSRKPVIVRDRIEQLTPGARRVELFSTQPDVAGWTHYGLAIDPSHDFRDPAFWDRAVNDSEALTP